MFKKMSSLDKLIKQRQKEEKRRTQYSLIDCIIDFAYDKLLIPVVIFDILWFCVILQILLVLK